jgi:hypothetical protein
MCFQKNLLELMYLHSSLLNLIRILRKRKKLMSFVLFKVNVMKISIRLMENKILIKNK